MNQYARNYNDKLRRELDDHDTEMQRINERERLKGMLSQNGAYLTIDGTRACPVCLGELEKGSPTHHWDYEEDVGCKVHNACHIYVLHHHGNVRKLKKTASKFDGMTWQDIAVGSVFRQVNRRFNELEVELMMLNMPEWYEPHEQIVDTYEGVTVNDC